MYHISALDLEHWADRIHAAAEFPRIASQSIYASGSGLRGLRMPGGEGILPPWLDGVVDCETGDDRLRSGMSA